MTLLALVAILLPYMHQDRLEGLQIARALAALSIAYCHSWHVTMPFPPGTAYPISWINSHGDLAVELFFAISGFVICLMVTSDRFELKKFALQRFFRLWPLWIATSFVYLYLTRYVGRSPDQTTSAFWYSVSLLPTQGYPFYDIGWSLQHEVAFYFLAALIVARLGIPALVGILVVGAAIDAAFDLPWYLHQYFSYYPYFAAGIAVFWARTSLSHLGTVIPFVIGSAIIAVAPPTLNPIALLFVLLGSINMKPAGIIARAFSELGDASYSIYLIHPLVFLWIYAHLQEPLPPLWMQEPLRFGAIAATCAISMVTWRILERPGMRIARILMTTRTQRA